MKLAVIGSINMDQVVTTDRLPGKGETIPGNDLAYKPGGKGANQAVAMARLGADVSMFGCVGDDANGHKLLDTLRAENIDCEDVDVVSGTPTGLAIINVAENDNIIILIKGANDLVDRAYFDRISGKLSEYDLVVLQHEIPIDTVHYAVSFCFDHDIPVVLNPAPADAVPEEIVEKVTYLTPNEHEAGLIFGEDVPLEDLLRKYPGKLIVTQGSKGVSAAEADGTILTVPCRESKVVDTTGAGDTLNGAFSVRIAAGDSIEEALRYANIAAGLSIEKFGAQSGMPTSEEVEAELG